jgi:hypothetical protein
MARPRQTEEEKVCILGLYIKEAARIRRKEKDRLNRLLRRRNQDETERVANAEIFMSRRREVQRLQREAESPNSRDTRLENQTSYMANMRSVQSPLTLANIRAVIGVVMYSNMDGKGNSISGLNAYREFKKVFLTPSSNFQGYSFG